MPSERSERRASPPNVMPSERSERQLKGLYRAKKNALVMAANPMRALRLRKGDETKTIQIKPVFPANNFFTLRSMAIAGHGVTVMPPFIAKEAVTNGQLVPALKDWTLEGNPMQVVMHQQRELPTRTKLFVDHLVSCITAAV